MGPQMVLATAQELSNRQCEALRRAWESGSREVVLLRHVGFKRRGYYVEKLAKLMKKLGLKIVEL